MSTPSLHEQPAPNTSDGESPSATCPSCRAALAPDAPAGLCPRCLLAGALAAAGGAGAATVAEGDAPHRPTGEAARLGRFGDYELLERIASGGMGVVYKARQISVNRVVALKMIIGGRLATEQEVLRFQAEAEAAANLDHPHIVPIYDVGEFEGRQFFTMKFIDGPNLAAKVEEFRKDSTAAAALIETCARAVHHGHRRGILHRDLKPGNLLLDGEGKPYVSDFGVAKRVDAPSSTSQTHTGTIIGTPAYMAPEQAAGKVKEITTAADVYSLGAVLYELLTGCVPFKAESLHDTLRMVREDPPTRPCSVDENIDADLETICLKCLEKDRHNRYHSAEELANELARFQRGEPILARPVSRSVRIWRWAKRHPLTAGFGATVAASLAFMLFASFFVARAHRTARINDVLQTNAYAAQWIAGTALLQLRDYCAAVERKTDADDALLAAMVRRGDRPAASAYLTRTFQAFNSPGSASATDRGKLAFDSAFIIGADGFTRARWPEPAEAAEYYATSFAHRDYLRGASRLAAERRRGVYVSRAFQSKADRMYKIGLARPILGDAGEFLGALVVTVATDPSFGSLNFRDQPRAAVLAAQLEVPTTDPTTVNQKDPQHIVLLHEGLAHGQYVPITHPKLSGFDPAPGRDALDLATRRDPVFAADYRDPVAALAAAPGLDPARYAGHHLAGFAQVGNTHLVVIVQTKYDDATALDRVLAARLAGWAVAALAVGAAVLAGVLWTVKAHRRRFPTT